MRGLGIAIFVAGFGFVACASGAGSTTPSSAPEPSASDSSTPSSQGGLASCETLLSYERALVDIGRAPFDNEDASLAVLSAVTPPDELRNEWQGLLTQASAAVASHVGFDDADKTAQDALSADLRAIDGFIENHMCDAPDEADVGCAPLDECAALIISGDNTDHEATSRLVEFSLAIATEPGWQVLLGRCQDSPLPNHARSFCDFEQHDGDRILKSLIVTFVYTSSARYLAWSGKP